MSSASVLLIEDDRFLRKACEAGLKKQDFVVSTAEDGKKGIQQALLESPDLILLDMLMPGFSGLETLKILKSDERTQGIPVVILSNSSVCKHLNSKFMFSSSHIFRIFFLVIPPSTQWSGAVTIVFLFIKNTFDLLPSVIQPFRFTRIAS